MIDVAVRTDLLDRYKKKLDFYSYFQLCEQVMPGYGATCGGRIQVTSNWLKISSPGYPNEFKEGQVCLITNKCDIS